MQPVVMRCPQCGAGLGLANAAGEHACTYCKHVACAAPSIATFAAAEGQLAARREEVNRQRAEEDVAGRRIGGIVALVLAIGLAVGAFVLFLTGVPAGPAIFVGVSGMLPGAGGIYALRYNARLRRMRARGLRGRATITSYKALSSTSFDLELTIAVPGRAPYPLTRKGELTSVAASVRVVAGAQVSVLVSPEDPRDVLIEWG